MRRSHRTTGGCNPPESDRFRLAQGKPSTQPECRPVLVRRRCSLLQAGPESAPRPLDRLRSIKSATYAPPSFLTILASLTSRPKFLALLAWNYSLAQNPFPGELRVRDVQKCRDMSKVRRRDSSFFV